MSSRKVAMRGSMIKGPRKSAKMVVTDFVRVAIAKIENQDQVPDMIRAQLVHQLRAMRDVAKSMGWMDIDKRIAQALAPPAPAAFGIEPMSQERIDAHSYAQANECLPRDFFIAMGKPIPPWAT